MTIEMTLRPFRPIKPCEIIHEEMETRGFDTTTFAENLGLTCKTLEEVIAGEQEIDSSIAKVLSQAFDTSPLYWLSLERAYQRDIGRYSKRRLRAENID